MPLAESTPQTTASYPADLREDYLRAFRHMLLARTVEDKLASIYRAGGRIVGGVYTGRGQEAFSVAAGIHLRKGIDIYGPLIRDQAGRIAYGEPIIDGVRTYLGAVTGPMRGRDGNIHRGRPQEGLLAMISHLGSLISVVAGMLFARKVRGELGDAVGATSIGDGGTSTGAFHEGLNLAAVENLPIVVSVANNQFAYSTPTARQYACHDLVDRAKGYGIEGYSVDATDLGACLRVFSHAFQRARSGHGPQFIVGTFLRLSGHGEHDDASYIPDACRHENSGRDCLKVAHDHILAQGWADEARISQWHAAARHEVEEAVAQVSNEPAPDPYRETWHAISNAALVEGQEE